MQTQFVDQIIRPKREGGCEWTNIRKVLISLRKNGVPVKELWWCLGGTGWSGRGSTDYYPAKLVLTANPNRPYTGMPFPEEVFDGGRLSYRRLLEVSRKLDDFFGHPVSSMIDIHKTLIVE